MNRYWSTFASTLLVGAVMQAAPAWGEHDAASPGNAQLCGVTRITDGDTLDVNCGGTRFTLRLKCIDAPESSQDPWGAMATRQLRQLLGEEVGVYGHERDQYGRVVSTIYAPNSGQNLNVAMVRQGAAAIYEQYCPARTHYPAYYEARDEALNAKRGIFETPGLQQTPWRYRRLE